MNLSALYDNGFQPFFAEDPFEKFKIFTNIG